MVSFKVPYSRKIRCIRALKNEKVAGKNGEWFGWQVEMILKNGSATIIGDTIYEALSSSIYNNFDIVSKQ